MYNYILLGLLLLFFTNCNTSKTKKNALVIDNINIEEYKTYGEKLDVDHIDDLDAITNKYDNLKKGDTINIAFSGVIDDVCQVKGCWMKVSLKNDKEIMIKFKDYGFFVPLTSTGNHAIIQGKAFVKTVSVEDQQHYAKDAGKPEEEIAKIIKPKAIYSLIADGVLINPNGKQ